MPGWSATSEAEAADNSWRAATRRAARALAGLGAQPRWITPEVLSAGELARDGTRLLVLPHSIALSNEEVAAVRSFAEAGGLILADVPPGERDALGRRRNAAPFADLIATRRLRFPATLQAEKPPPDEMAALLAEAGVHPPLALLDATGRPAADLDIRLFRSGGMMIAGIQRQDGTEGERPVELRLPGRLWCDPCATARRRCSPTGLSCNLALSSLCCWHCRPRRCRRRPCPVPRKPPWVIWSPSGLGWMGPRQPRLMSCGWRSSARRGRSCRWCRGRCECRREAAYGICPLLLATCLAIGRCA